MMRISSAELAVVNGDKQFASTLQKSQRHCGFAGGEKSVGLFEM